MPETRAAWAIEPLGPPHRVGLQLAIALEAARDGDLSPVGQLSWPDAGVVRAHLPLPWVVELAAAGLAAGNEPGRELLEAVGPRGRPALQTLADALRSTTIVSAARSLLAELPGAPTADVDVRVLGPLAVLRSGEATDHPDLRRTRVRELLSFIVIRRQARREEVADGLWPDLVDGGRNLRVTLSYLQRVLEPERGDGEPPYFLRSDGTWLRLAGTDRLRVDAWELDRLLDDAAEAERSASPAIALAAYRAALPLWRGDPYSDVPFASWAEPERTRLRNRYTVAAVRAGELLLAAGALTDAGRAAERALCADVAFEPAYRLLARVHLADGNPAGASRAIDACRSALADLGVEPDASTIALQPLTFG